MTHTRDELIKLVNDSVPPWYGEFARYQVNRIMEDGAADAILAAGWTPPKPVEFGRWYRTLTPDGRLWAETSDPQDWYLAHPDPSVTLTWQRITTDEQWVPWEDHPTDMVHPSAIDWGD